MPVKAHEQSAERKWNKEKEEVEQVDAPHAVLLSPGRESEQPRWNAMEQNVSRGDHVCFTGSHLQTYCHETNVTFLISSHFHDETRL